MHRLTIFSAAIFIFLGCASMPPAPVADPVSDLRVANGRIRLADRDTDPSTFFVIQNQGANPRLIVGGSCMGCKDVEIRRAMVKDGAMASVVLSEWELPAGGSVAFAPRGLSLSLVGVKGLNAGDIVQVELEFADGEKFVFNADVHEE